LKIRFYRNKIKILFIRTTTFGFSSQNNINNFYLRMKNFTAKEQKSTGRSKEIAIPHLFIRPYSREQEKTESPTSATPMAPNPLLKNKLLAP
jgi:hypothetical protein